jgi:hypothetical protein
MAPLLLHFLQAGGTLAVKVVALQHHMGPGREAALRREALVLELAAMQDYRHPHLMPMQVRCSLLTQQQQMATYSTTPTQAAVVSTHSIAHTA